MIEEAQMSRTLTTVALMVLLAVVTVGLVIMSVKAINQPSGPTIVTQCEQPK